MTQLRLFVTALVLGVFLKHPVAWARQAIYSLRIQYSFQVIWCFTTDHAACNCYCCLLLLLLLLAAAGVCGCCFLCYCWMLLAAACCCMLLVLVVADACGCWYLCLLLATCCCYCLLPELVVKATSYCKVAATNWQLLQIVRMLTLQTALAAATS